MTDMQVTLIDTMGSDLSVVNAARVSFDKESEWDKGDRWDDRWADGCNRFLSQRDTKLISYLAKHNHWSPFSHAFASFRIKAPIFVARQLGKHQVGLSWNEVSRRYVDGPPEFYTPEGWRKRAESVKQGSSDDIVLTEEIVGAEGFFSHGAAFYQDLIDSGVCPEQARMVLPQSMMTEWIWSGSLYAFARVCQLRLDSHTQLETRIVAKHIADAMNERFPVSWEALMNTNKD